MNNYLYKHGGFEPSVISMLEKVPILSTYAKTRGWHFIITWCHRITGILLLMFVWFHIYSLRALNSPDIYDAKMKLFRLPFFVFLEWLLTIPVAFHAFNGGRLILYESFRIRDDASSYRWVLSLSMCYVVLVGLFMVLGSQSVSAFLFWSTMLAIALMLVYAVACKVWSKGHSVFWIFQRISGTFLLVMVPAHFLFMHLNPMTAKDASTVLIRMHNIFIKILDFFLVLAILYHGGYGLFSVVRDWIPSGILRAGITALVTLVVLIFAWFGVSLLFAA